MEIKLSIFNHNIRFSCSVKGFRFRSYYFCIFQKRYNFASLQIINDIDKHVAHDIDHMYRSLPLVNIINLQKLDQGHSLAAEP